MRTNYLLCSLFLIGFMSLNAQGQRTERMQNQSLQQVTQSSALEDSIRKERFKGSYLTVSAGLGSSSFDYKLKGLNEQGTRKGQLGYSIDLKYSYFFNPHWGFTTGVGISRYQTKGKLTGGIDDNSFYNLGLQTDNDEEGRPREFQLRARIKNLEEKQTAFFIEIPLMLSYQTHFGDSAKWGMYGGIGAKVQFPVNTKFRIQNGSTSEFNVSGWYEGIPTDMGAPSNPPVLQHGYGTITDPNSSLGWDDKAKLKMGIAATAELGFMFALSNGMDLMVGGYIDYGLNDIKKNGKRDLFTAQGAYHPAANNNIGKSINYNGMLNSNATDKIKMISFGGKVSLRFKMGSKKEKSEQYYQSQQQNKY